MKRVFVVLSLIAIFSCARGFIIRSPRAGDKRTKTVWAIWQNPNPEEWRRSKWYRLNTDVVTPFKVIISVDDFGCIMNNLDVNEPRHNEYYACADGWRAPHYAN